MLVVVAVLLQVSITLKAIALNCRRSLCRINCMKKYRKLLKRQHLQNSGENASSKLRASSRSPTKQPIESPTIAALVST